MSLDTVAEDVKEEAREDAEEIRTEGERRAEEIVDAAEADAEEIIDDREAEIDDRIARERERTLSSAKLEAKQQRLEARRDALEDVRGDAEDAIADIGGETRADLTRALLDDAATEFEGRSVRVYGRAEDATLLEEVLADYEGFEYAGEYDCLGGIVAESDSSRVRVNNTFDSILEELWDDELREVSTRLFENGEGRGESASESGDVAGVDTGTTGGS
jgi:V/A-type H+-transporting ATPase subunit E